MALSDPRQKISASRLAPAPAPEVLRGKAGVVRWLELISVFGLVPIGLFFVRSSFARWIVPALLLAAAVCILALLRDPRFDRGRLGARPGALGRELPPILKTFVPGALLIGALTALGRPDLLFAFPREQPGWWAVIMIAYPLLSVYPQEILFRTFFFHRYGPLLRGEGAVVASSALVFGLAHLLFANWIAPTLTMIGGYLFARTYARSGSTAVASLEHALWGDFLFTLGLGWYFWGGSIRAVAG
ncbi:MAG: CPBP family intramembrane glutamic endopeptidase [Acidobacteriota bacterium]